MDVILFDTDYELNHDVWEVLNSPPLLPYHIIGLLEGPLNGGTMFVRCAALLAEPACSDLPWCCPPLLRPFRPAVPPRESGLQGEQRRT